MSSNGLNLLGEHQFYPGIFAELNPYDNPVSTLLAQKGFRIEAQKEYTFTTHTNLETTSSPDLKPDNASPTFGSSTFGNGSNIINILYRGAQVTWARQGDQDLGRVKGWQGPGNPSREEDPMARAIAEALGNMKSDLEYVGREGIYSKASTGTTGINQQRGYRYAPGIQQQLADGAVVGAGDGTMGTLNFTVVRDGLEKVWKSRMWTNGRPLTCITNSTGKKGLTDAFVDHLSLGKNSVSRNEAGVNLERFETDFGNVDVVLAHNIPENTMYFLNLDEMSLVARPVPGRGFFFSKKFGEGNEKAAEGEGIYAEVGIDHGVGSTHLRLAGVGSVVVDGGQTISAT